MQNDTSAANAKKRARSLLLWRLGVSNSAIFVIFVFTTLVIAYAGGIVGYG